jgi:very-short-patch-repair endonuclease
MKLAEQNAALASIPEPRWYLDHVLAPPDAATDRDDDRSSAFADDYRGMSPVAEVAHWWQQRADELRTGSAVERCAVRQGFVLTRAQALELGTSRATIRRMLYRGTWWSPRRGVLAVVAVPRADVVDLHAVQRARRCKLALACTAAALANPGHVVSGTGAATLYGLPLFTRPTEPQLTAAPPRTPGHRADALVRPAGLAADEVTTWYGAAVTTPARSLVDLARHNRRDGLVAADAAMRELGLRAADLDVALARARGWPGVRRARGVLCLADPLAESPLESITRLACHDAELPVPELQVPIHDPATGRTDRVDALWRAQRVILEMDGKVKYTGQELRREKRRQERLARLGYAVVRVLWADVVHNWPATLVRIRAALADV